MSSHVRRGAVAFSVVVLLSVWVEPGVATVVIKSGTAGIGAYSALQAMVQDLGFDVIVVTDPHVFVTLLQDHAVEIVIVDGWWKQEFETIGDPLLRFFQDGGSLMGYYNSGHQVGGALATAVFPANGTLHVTNPKTTLLCSILARDHLVCQGLPQEFEIRDSELVFHGEKVGREYVYQHHDLPEGCLTLIADRTYNAPVLLAYERLGRSVYFAGGGVTTTKVPAYLSDANFQELLGRSLQWLKQGNGTQARKDQISSRTEDGLARTRDNEARVRDIRRGFEGKKVLVRYLLGSLAICGLVIGAYLLIKKPET